MQSEALGAAASSAASIWQTPFLECNTLIWGLIVPAPPQLPPLHPLTLLLIKLAHVYIHPHNY